VDKNDQVCAFLIQMRDSIEDFLDELMPPPEEELEELSKRSPPQEGRSVIVTTKDSRGGLQTKIPR